MEMSFNSLQVTAMLGQLHQAGLRGSIARLTILESIYAAGNCEMSVDDVSHVLFQRGAKISMGSVFKCLHELQCHGLLDRKKIPHGKSVFWLSETVLRSISTPFIN